MANAIILTDFTDSVFLTRILGPYKVAHELRKLGIQTTVINHIHMWKSTELQNFVASLINDQTLFVGINNMYFKDCEAVDFYSNSTIKLKPAKPGMLLPHGADASAKFLSFIRDKKLPLVLGGPTAHDRAYNSEFDYLLQGYTEASVSHFVNHLKHQANIPGSYKSIFGPIVVPDLNQAHNWNFQTSSMQWHDHDAVLPGETLSIEIARGCIFKCKFCSYPLIGKKKFDYIRHFDVIKQELVENYEKFGVTRYYFSDETFNDSVHKLEYMYQLASELPFKLEYFAYLRLDLVIKNPHTIDLLYGSGLRATHFGIETLHPQAGRAIGKHFKSQQVIDILDRFKHTSHGEINLHGSFIVGLPYESSAHVVETFDRLKSRQIALDSFVYFPLYISKPGLRRDSWFSQNYENYGYRIMKQSDQRLLYEQKFPEHIAWENTHMNCMQAMDLAQSLDQESFNFKKLGGLASFEMAGLDLPWQFFHGKTYNEIDWHAVTQRKIHRFHEYKNKIVSTLRKTTEFNDKI